MTMTIKKSIKIDFAHHLRGHTGLCINIHGHTWKFELELSGYLNEIGFVADLSDVKKFLLTPVKEFLDHSLVTDSTTFMEIEPHLAAIGDVFFKDRKGLRGDDIRTLRKAQAYNVHGLRVAVFPYIPTCELLAKWFFELSQKKLKSFSINGNQLRVHRTFVHESSTSCASYAPGR